MPAVLGEKTAVRPSLWYAESFHEHTEDLGRVAARICIVSWVPNVFPRSLGPVSACDGSGQISVVIVTCITIVSKVL